MGRQPGDAPPEGEGGFAREAQAAQQQVKELQQKWQEKWADFQRSDRVATMNGRLVKEVEAGKEMVVQLKAAAKAAADQH